MAENSGDDDTEIDETETDGGDDGAETELLSMPVRSRRR